VLLAGATAPEPLPAKDLVEADLWDQLPADLSALLAILPQADLYLQDEIQVAFHPTRDAEAATRFFAKALRAMSGSAPQGRPLQEQVEEPAIAAPKTSTSAPRVINVDKNSAYPKAMAELKASGVLPESVELRQVKYFNTIVEQDHRFIKRRVNPGLGFFSFETEWNTLQGYEVMNMVRKGQMRSLEKGDIMGQIAFIASLYGVAA
jgi:transposase, IS6 family